MPIQTHFCQVAPGNQTLKREFGSNKVKVIVKSPQYTGMFIRLEPMV